MSEVTLVRPAGRPRGLVWPWVGWRPALLAALVFAVLSITYGLMTPVLEGPDEPWHFAFIRHVVQHRSLPSAHDPAAVAAIEQEVSQPPLYYVLMAAATFWLDASDYPQAFPRNRHFPGSAPGWVNDNKNRYAHRVDEDFPYERAALAIRVTRWLTALISALAVVATYGLARTLWPDEPLMAGLAALTLAFTPTFLYIGGVVSNDGLATALSATALWAMAALIRYGLSLKRLVWLGVALGLGWLTKVSLVGLLAPAGLSLLLALWPSPGTRPASWRPAALWPPLKRLIVAGLIVVGLALLIAGWWYVRNYLIYGEPFAITPHTETGWARDKPPRLIKLLNDVDQVWWTYWGAFGWGNINFQEWVITVITWAATLALVGLVVWLVLGIIRQRRRLLQAALGSPEFKITLVLLATCLVYLALLTRWNQIVWAPWGRLLFPAAPAIAVFLVAGWRGVALAFRADRRVVALPVVGLAALALAAPWWTVQPAYARPRLLSEAEVAALEPQLNVRLGDVARLVSYAPERDRIRASEDFVARLCWEPLRRTETPLSVFVQLVGQNDRNIAGFRSYPGLGAYPTNGWIPNCVFCETVRAPVKPDEIRPDQPELMQVEVGLFNRETGERLPSFDAEGKPVGTNYIGQVKIAPLAPPMRVYTPDPDVETDYSLGGQVRLLGYSLTPAPAAPGERVTLKLDWQAVAPPSADYQVFLQLFDPAGTMVAQFDGPPVSGVYPTSWWDEGESVPDTHILSLPSNLPPGRYRLLAGLYRLDTGERLPVAGGSPREGAAMAIPLDVRGR